MTDALQKPKKQVDPAEFSATDLSKSQRNMLLVSLALVAISGALQWLGGSAGRYSSEVKGAALQVYAVAHSAEEGASKISAGGGAKLSQAIDRLPDANDAVQRVPVAGLHSLLGTLSGEFELFQRGYFDFRAALETISARKSAADAFSVALSQQYPAIDALSKRLVDGRFGVRAIESVSRLAAYAESGVTPATAVRAEYDVRNAAFELQGTELRAAWLQIERSIAGPAKLAAATPLRPEEVVEVAAKAQKTRSQARQVAESAANSSAHTLFSFLGMVAFVAGLFMLFRGARTIAADFNRRFKRAVGQFHGGEEALEKAQGGLKALLDGRFETKVPERHDEFGGFTRSLNEVIERIRFTSRELLSMIEKLGTAKTGLESVKGELNTVMNSVESLVNDLDTFSSEILNNDIDARAAMFSASFAAERASESEGVIREAMARVESMREGLQEASKSVKRIGERSLETGEAVAMFAQLSEQISVLSLNASLEAERAGESGRGFKIVASEVRALARRADEAVVKMTGLVQGAQADARSAQQAVDRSTSQIVSGSHVGVVANSLTSSSATVLSRVQALTRAISGGGGRIRAAAKRVEDKLGGVIAKTQKASDQITDVNGVAGEVTDSARGAANRFMRRQA